MHTCSSVTLVWMFSSNSLSSMLPSDGGRVPVFLYLVFVFSHREKMLWIACDVVWRRGRRQHTPTLALPPSKRAMASQSWAGAGQRRAEVGRGRWRRAASGRGRSPC